MVAAALFLFSAFRHRRSSTRRCMSASSWLSHISVRRRSKDSEPSIWCCRLVATERIICNLSRCHEPTKPFWRHEWFGGPKGLIEHNHVAVNCYLSAFSNFLFIRNVTNNEGELYQDYILVLFTLQRYYPEVLRYVASSWLCWLLIKNLFSYSFYFITWRCSDQISIQKTCIMFS